MTEFPNTLLIEGEPKDLSEELAQFIDGIKKTETVYPEVSRLCEANKLDDVLKVLITNASALNSAPEKGTFTVAIATNLPHLGFA